MLAERADEQPKVDPFGRGPLTALMPPDTVAACDFTNFHPYPTASEYDAWVSLPVDVQERIEKRYAAAKSMEWPVLTATLFGEYTRTGTRVTYEVPNFRRRTILRDRVLGAVLESAHSIERSGTVDPASMETVVDALWSICEESSWAVPAHTPKGEPLPDTRAPVLDLFAAETGAQLSWTLYLLGDQLDLYSPQVRQRIRNDVDERILTPALEGEWHWLHLHDDHANNWTPWVVSNVFACLWMTASFDTEEDRTRNAAIISRMISAMDVYAHSLAADGSCSEGQSYWLRGPARLFDALWQLHLASGGELRALALPVLQQMVKYPVAMHIDGNRMVQHSDGPARWAGEPAVLHRWGRYVNDAEAIQLALYLSGEEIKEEQREIEWLTESLVRLFEPGFPDSGRVPPPAVGEHWFPDAELLTIREHPGSTNGLLLAVKGGHNDEDHNHNDVGSFSIALNGTPEIIDPGVEDYTEATFSGDRYNIWTMCSDWHNLPVVNGYGQSAGRQYKAQDVRTSSPGRTVRRTMWEAELSAAWPAEANLLSWHRTLLFNPPQRSIELRDEWDISGLKDISLPLTCRAEPTVENNFLLMGNLCLDITSFTIEVEKKVIPEGDRLEPTWGRALWRAILKPRESSGKGMWVLRFCDASER